MKSHVGPHMRVISAVTELLVPTAHADVGFNAYASMFQLQQLLCQRLQTRLLQLYKQVIAEEKCIAFTFRVRGEKSLQVTHHYLTWSCHEMKVAENASFVITQLPHDDNSRLSGSPFKINTSKTKVTQQAHKAHAPQDVPEFVNECPYSRQRS